MSKIAVIYWSGTGNTQQMAEAIANQAHADLFTASEFTADKAANYDAFAFGCSAMGAEQLEEERVRADVERGCAGAGQQEGGAVRQLRLGRRRVDGHLEA